MKGKTVRLPRALVITLLLSAPAFGRNQPETTLESRRTSNHEAPTTESALAPSPNRDIRERVARAVVVIEPIDRDGHQMSPASAFVDSRGLVVTNRHCVEGALAVKLNLGADGLFDLTTIVSDSPDLDIVLLKGNFPSESVGRLEWASAVPAKGSALWVAVRDYKGHFSESPGRFSTVDYASGDSMLVLTTSCPAWLGCSGSPLMDLDGRVVGVVNRLGNPVSGQSRTSAEAALGADVLALPTTNPIAISDWVGADNDPRAHSFYSDFASGRSIMFSDPKGAEHYFRAALDVHPNHVKATEGLAQSLEVLGRSNEAAEILKKLGDTRPSDPEPGFVLGNCLFRLRKYPQAIAAYQDSLKARPTGATWFWLGTAQWTNQDLTSAAFSYEQAVILEPRHTSSWGRLTQVYMALGRPDEVARTIRRRLQLEPDDADLVDTLADAEMRAGHMEEQAAALKRLRELNPYLSNRAQIPQDGQSRGETRK